MNSFQDIQEFRNQIFQKLGKGRNAFMDLMLEFRLSESAEKWPDRVKSG
jgi:hypothetical protein